MQKNPFPLAYLAFVAFGFYEGLIGVSWPAMSVEFGMPLEALGVLFAVSLVGFVLVSFASGSLIRRRSIHWLILTSLVLRAIGFFGFTFAPNWHFLILSIFVLSLGGGGMDTGLNGFISARGNAKQLNWLHASYGVGATVGPFLASAVATLDGTWRWNFGFLAALLLLVSVLVWVSRPAWGLALKETDSNKGAGTRQTMRLPIVWISVLIFFLYTGTELAAGQWSFTLFTIGRGETELAARFWVGIYWGAFTAGRILFGFIADRISIDRFLRFGIIAVVTGAGLLWWNPVTWVGYVGLALMGLAQAPVFPGLIAGTMRRVGEAHESNVIGFQIGAAGLGGTAITSIVGLLATSIHMEVIGAALFILSFLTLVVYEALMAASRRAIRE
jgi:fucose permease